ncbi:hypothetical protein RND71_024500 [Anisodus tanguticus]|uniref:Uncharacterized protein n=1 Tax=Anisodus tanguticus TaxID=243964 RepID=A0AAE1RNB3_9SOLA|nr:hypothetical protein RND71_024500 [Anisodus tanguticus]
MHDECRPGEEDENQENEYENDEENGCRKLGRDIEVGEYSRSRRWAELPRWAAEATAEMGCSGLSRWADLLYIVKQSATEGLEAMVKSILVHFQLLIGESYYPSSAPQNSIDQVGLVKMEKRQKK